MRRATYHWALRYQGTIRRKHQVTHWDVEVILKDNSSHVGEKTLSEVIMMAAVNLRWFFSGLPRCGVLF